MRVNESFWWIQRFRSTCSWLIQTSARCKQQAGAARTWSSFRLRHSTTNLSSLPPSLPPSSSCWSWPSSLRSASQSNGPSGVDGTERKQHAHQWPRTQNRWSKRHQSLCDHVCGWHHVSSVWPMQTCTDHKISHLGGDDWHLKSLLTKLHIGNETAEEVNVILLKWKRGGAARRSSCVLRVSLCQ